MATTKAQIKATNKYMSKNYDSLRIVVPKGRKVDIEQHAQRTGESVNALVNRLLRSELSMTDDAWRLKVTEERTTAPTPGGNTCEPDPPF